MQKFLLFIGMFLSTFIHAQNLNDQIKDTSKADAVIKNATVYFGYGAELTHETRVKVDANTRIIVINQLSTAIDLNSLQVSCPEDVALLSQKFNVYYPSSPIMVKTKQVLIWEDSIKRIEKDISRVETDIVIEQEVLAKTGLLIESTVENKTISSTEVLKLVEYYTAKIGKAKNNIYNYNQTISRKNIQIGELREKIAEAVRLATPPQLKPYGQLILQVMCSKVAEIPVLLSYYTNNAGWTPVYDIRVNSKTNKVKLVYKASLTQTTGIDWRKTKLTLSTGTPTFGVTAPILSPWYLQLYVPGLYTDLQRRAVVGNAMRNTIQSYEDDKVLSEVIVSGYGTVRKEKAYLDTIDPSTLQQFTTLNEGQLNTNFEIDLPYDIESDGQLHSVNIKDEEIICTLKNYAVPRSDKEAYLLAEVADWENLDLLPGDANIIMDDTYIGKSIIDPNTTADTLNLSLGRDKRLAVKRSLIKELSSLKTSGRDSRQVFTYELIVKNNKLTDVNMLLKDQYPLSTIKEVEVKLDESGDASINEETGVLTWKVNLKPGESKKLRFSYTVKYPKDKRIVNLK